MSKPAEIELAQLKAAVDYLASVFEEGSLAAQYDPTMRAQVADILRLLLKKVSDLPEGIPEHLVQAAAVRALIGATDERVEALYNEDSEKLRHNMHQARVAATLQGHTLGPWQPRSDPGVDQEFFAVCQGCGGIVNVNPHSTTDLMTDHAARSNEEKPSGDLLKPETIVALWDLTQTESP